jgi:hypothetical protein
MRAARWWTIPLLAALAAHAPPARAEIDVATRAAARATAEEALTHFDKGDFAGALDLFNRADALVHAPTLGLMAARCLDKLGRLVEASERYLAVTRIKLDPHAPAAQSAAQTTAEQERAALLPRVPGLIITVEGPGVAEARVTLDGKAIPAELLGIKRPTDPGPHQLEATRGTEVVSQKVVLEPGASTPVTLRLTGAGTMAPAPPPTTPPPQPQPAADAGLRPMARVGVALSALGGAGLVVGAITGGLALGEKSSLDGAGCSGGHCPTSQQDAVSRYNTMRLVSGGALIAGGVVAATGIALAVAGSRAGAKAAQARWSPWIGLGAVGLEGTF